MNRPAAAIAMRLRPKSGFLVRPKSSQVLHIVNPNPKVHEAFWINRSDGPGRVFLNCSIHTLCDLAIPRPVLIPTHEGVRDILASLAFRCVGCAGVARAQGDPSL